ncbi:hypothetical protein [Azoarcus sp. KH32C]|uniref:hypothetical protein n=1 Tax=Azoarcus sp. KH32C TaxID=748247 RepID=UPI0005A20D20|nr:hypothetical protein [Azoarcus sp. KH32C]
MGNSKLVSAHRLLEAGMPAKEVTRRMELSAEAMYRMLVAAILSDSDQVLEGEQKMPSVVALAFAPAAHRRDAPQLACLILGWWG